MKVNYVTWLLSLFIVPTLFLISSISIQVTLLMFDSDGNPMECESSYYAPDCIPPNSQPDEPTVQSTSEGNKRKKPESADDEVDSEILKMARKAFSPTNVTTHTAWATHAAMSLENMSSYHAALAKVEMDKILLNFHPDNPALYN
jgi:hypothetical protein